MKAVSIQKHKPAIKCDLCDDMLVDEYHNVYQHQMNKHGKLGNIRGKRKGFIKQRQVKAFADQTKFLRYSIMNPITKEVYIMNYPIADWVRWSKTKLDFLSTKNEFDLMLMAAVATFKIEYADFL